MILLISGISGKLGQAVKKHLQARYTVHGHTRNMCLVETIKKVKPDIILDVTSALSVHHHLDIYLALCIPTIIGTSGLQPKESYKYVTQCNFPLLIVPNFSLSFQSFFKQALALNKLHPVTNIIETHHMTKIDKPSGSSLYLSYALRDAPIESHRLDCYIAKHEVIFAAPHEKLILTHQITHPDAFLTGVDASLQQLQKIHCGTVLTTNC